MFSGVDESLGYLPLQLNLKDGTNVIVDNAREQDYEQIRTLLNNEIERGLL